MWCLNSIKSLQNKGVEKWIVARLN
jgi:hypothetical protein